MMLGIKASLKLRHALCDVLLKQLKELSILNIEDGLIELRKAIEGKPQ